MTNYLLYLDNISIKNKYYTYYKSLIIKAKSRHDVEKIDDYQLHHIVPKSFIIPDIEHINSVHNLVPLNQREHVLAHRLLTKFIVGDNRVKALKAFYAMNMHNPTEYLKSQLSQTKENINVINNPNLKLLYDSEWLYNAYIVEKKSSRAIAYELSTSKGTVLKSLHKARIPTRDRDYSNKAPEWYAEGSIDDLKNELQYLVTSGKSNETIGIIFGVHKATIQKWCKKLEIKARLWQLKDYDWLYTKYVEEGKSMEEIAIILKCNPSTVNKWMKKNNITRRTLKEAQTLRYSKKK